MYRFVLDVEIAEDRGVAKEKTTHLLKKLREIFHNSDEFPEMNDASYRLQNDSDRNKKNHMIENENGHVGNAKAKLFE
jgi:hypothetical protein